MAGALRGEPVEMIKCETVDLEVPATTEIVIEGEVLPKERLYEGPFGEYTGYRASPRDRRPVYRVKAITHRNNPILAISCMGIPVDDAHITTSLADSAEIFRELQRKGFPVLDTYIYPESAHCLCVVQVRTKGAEPNVAERVAHTVYSSEAGRNIPYVIVVDDDIDIYDVNQLVHTWTTKCHPYRGIQRIEHAVGSPLMPFENYYERLHRLGARAYFDCTWPLDWDPAIAVPPKSSFASIYPQEIQEHVLKNWKSYGFKES
jgi:4-hydroxy-3-polyprenylbenzoate decarboxylase